MCVLHAGQHLEDMESIDLDDCSLGFYVSDVFDDNDNISTFISATFTGISWPVSQMTSYIDAIQVNIYTLVCLLMCLCVHFSV